MINTLNSYQTLSFIVLSVVPLGFFACDNSNDENNLNLPSAQNQIPLPIRQGLNKIDNELCEVWEALSNSNILIRQQKAELDKSNEIISTLLLRIKKLEELTNNHTHEYYLSHTHGGTGPRTQTSRPKRIQDILAIAKPLQIQIEKTSGPVVKRQ